MKGEITLWLPAHWTTPTIRKLLQSFLLRRHHHNKGAAVFNSLGETYIESLCKCLKVGFSLVCS